MRLTKKTVAFCTAAAVGLLLVTECLLHVLSWIFPRVDVVLSPVPVVKDPRLGWRPSAYHPEHDRLGFRNPSVPAPGAAAIVVLGDSQTYGMGVAAEQAWPRQLAARGGIRTYSMAYGGYGPAHSLVLLDEAIALRPTWIIEALYTGNDLYDSFQLVYGRKQLPELRSSDETTVRRIESLEKTEPLRKKISRLQRKGEHRGAFRTFLAEHSRLYGLLRAGKRALKGRTAPGTPKTGRPSAQTTGGAQDERLALDNGTVATILTPRYRLCGLDLEDARIAEGLRISLEAIRRMSERTRSEKIRLAVVLIPTKELVFGDVAEGRVGALPDVFRRLLANEETVLSDTRRYLEDHGIPCIDALPALRESLRRGEQPYKTSSDGHPNPAGHRAIADRVRSEIRKLEATGASDP